MMKNVRKMNERENLKRKKSLKDKLNRCLLCKLPARKMNSDPGKF